MQDAVKTIRRFFNNAEAEFARSLLVSVGIGAVLSEENAANTLGALARGVQLQVPDEDEAAALEILEGRSEEFAPLPDDFVPPQEEVSVGNETAPHSTGMIRKLTKLIPLLVVVALAVRMVLVEYVTKMPNVDSTEELTEKGDAAAKKGDYGKALNYFNSALNADPRNYLAYYDRGFVFFERNEYQNAIADFSDSIKLNSQFSRSYAERAIAYDKLGIYDKALDDANKSMELDAQDVNSHIAHGIVNDDTGGWDAAITDYTEAVRLNPADATAYFDRSLVYAKKKEYDKALDDANECIRLEPGRPENYSNRGLIYSRMEKNGRALEDFDRAINNDPSYVPNYVNRALVYDDTGELGKALADLNKAIGLDPKNINAYDSRGYIYSEMGDAGNALADYQHVISLSSDDASGFSSLAWLYATFPKSEVRDGVKALELATKACELSKWKDYYSISALAAAEAETGKFDDAVKHQQQALEMAKADKVGPKMLGEMADALTCYQQKQPYRDVKK